MEVEIVKQDHLGRGIGYINGKVCFVPFSLPGDILDIEITKENKNFLEGKINNIIKPSDDRVESMCPFFGKCGGCQFLNTKYENTLDYKLNRIKDILKKVDYDGDIKIIKSDDSLNYRNKIELKIKNDKIGYYQNKTNELIEIDNCLVSKKCINKAIKLIDSFKLENAFVTIRCNFTGEVLINITSEDSPVINNKICEENKVVGIILNDKTIYGENHFIDKVGNLFFEVSYDSFFQINSSINEKLMSFISENAYGNVLDLYCGVGSLSLAASKNAKKVIGIEVVENAIINALKNARINNIKNVDFILGKVEDKIEFIKDNVDTIIVDPPRRGLDDNTINNILKILPKRIIYVSCDAQSLVNNLKDLMEAYNIKNVTVFDMFPFTYHCETVCILERK